MFSLVKAVWFLMKLPVDHVTELNENRGKGENRSDRRGKSEDVALRFSVGGSMGGTDNFPVWIVFIMVQLRR